MIRKGLDGWPILNGRADLSFCGRGLPNEGEICDNKIYCHEFLVYSYRTT